MSKEKLIPVLRFHECKNTGEWEINEFGDLINILADYTANGSFASLKENVTYYSSEEYAVLVRTTDLDKKIFTPARFTDKKGYEFLSKTSLFGNEIVMANVGSIGKVFRVPNYDKPMTLAPNTYVLKFNDFVDEDFIYQLMLRAEFEKKLLSMVGSSTLMAINKSNLRSIKVSIPAKKEQQKIASCLSSLDEVIAAQSQKLDLLKDHKKGLMQNLFPQEGEKVPKYRFKEFEKDGEWVEKKLGQIGEPLMCKRIFKEQTTTNPNNVIPFYKIGTFGKRADAYISIEMYEEFKTKYSFPEVGDILISASGTIGRLVVYDGSPAYFQDSNIVWLGNDEKQVLNGFLHHCYSIVKWQTSDGGVISRLYNSDLKNISVKFPKNPKEQQKITACLSSLDALITVQTEKIEQLKLHKKGLMQCLFQKIKD